MARVRYWIWLSCVHGVRPIIKSRLLDALGGPDAIYDAAWEELASVPGIKPQEANLLLNRDMSAADEAISFCLEHGISFLTLQDAQYPECLRNIPDPPVVLYVWGRLPPVDECPTFAIVGTRKASVYGLRMSAKLGRELAQAGSIIVSGLATGCDAEAMDAALRAGGPVIGVLGTSIDTVYPAKNRALFEQVKGRGALVSEYPPRMRTYPQDFKDRNRIISGLSLGVVVAEAPIRSGTRVTVDHALDQGRDVFAVPGNADAAASEGCNDLLAHGAILVTKGADVLEEYTGRPDLHPYTVSAPERMPPRATPIKKEIDKPKDIVYIDLTEAEKTLPPDQFKILKALTRPGMYVDELIEAAEMPASAVLGALTMLEIAGWVAREGRLFTRKK